MQILPAIDLRGGRCVRLRQGKFDDETVFGDDPAAIARHWVDEGAAALHLVDLDGAREGHPVNGACIERVVQAAGVPCQLGGGLREEADVSQAFSWGVERVVLGTRALKDPAWLEAICERYPRRVAVGLDARGGRPATHGWTEISDRDVLEAARALADHPLAALIYTNIDDDGMLTGPDWSTLGKLAAAVSLPIIASGGVAGLDHIRRLKESGLAGCIVGRALYEGQLSLREALAAAGS